MVFSDPAPLNSAVTPAITAPNDGFYTPVTFKGAFGKKSLWVQNWTAPDVMGFLPADTVVTPPAATTPNAVTLTIAPSGGNVLIYCSSQTGFSYQLESSVGIAPAAWGNEGSAQPGTGSTLTFTVPASAAEKFFHVKVQ